MGNSRASTSETSNRYRLSRILFSHKPIPLPDPGAYDPNVMKQKRFALSVILSVAAVTAMSAADVSYKVQGLIEGTEGSVSLGSSTWLSTNIVKSDGEYSFKDVPAGLHAIKITASGYNVPESQLVRVNEDGSVDPMTGINLVVTPMADNPDQWLHEWRQDGSVEGYTQTSHINTLPEIEFLGKKIVPSDVPYTGILTEEYHMILSDELMPWPQEYAYRLVETLKTLPADYYNRPMTKCILSADRLTEDIILERNGEGNILTISKDAFTYANPFLVNLDGVRGRFYSKRLHHAMTKVITDFGEDRGAIDRILLDRFGVSVNVPDYAVLTAGITNEDENSFKQFGPSELVAIINMFEELPEGFHKTPHLNYLVRRIDGMRHPLYPDAAGVAWCVDNGYIEFMNNDLAHTFSGNNENFETQRLILHEKTHFLWAYLFSEELKNDWIEVGGWYRDPNAGDDPDDGWSTTKTTEFVSQYAHGKNPNEDMAESVAFYLKDPEKLQSRAPLKYEFIRDRVMHGTRYISSIPDYLTFEVLNLYPDYDYPGKIKRVSITVDGAPEEKKMITMEVELNHEEGFQDEASGAYVRITSPVFYDQFGEKKFQFVDLGMSPVDGNGHILRGSAEVDEHSKSGYWHCGDITTTDLAGNERFEGKNDCVTNVYINNPKEDLETPIYKEGSLKYELTEGEDEGHKVQLLKVSYEVSDNVGIRHTFVRIDNDYEGWSKGGTGLTDCYGGYNPETGLAEITYVIPEFYPSANYFATFISVRDLAGTEMYIPFDESERKMIAITTPNPDYEAPEIDLNRILVYAEPTHPDNPDGETIVTVNFYARDNISGFGPMGYWFRDPQGLIHGNYWFYHEDSDGRYFNGDPTVWKHYKLTHILPQGSAPGIWGLSQIEVADKAGNVRTYNFVETLIFEPDDSDDYVLFADMKENDILAIGLESSLYPTSSFAYRIIHEDTGKEINGVYGDKDDNPKRIRKISSEPEEMLNVDVSTLPAGKLIVLVTVKDEAGENKSIKSATVYRNIETGIKDVVIDTSAPYEIYNLSGTRVSLSVDQLPAATYILRQNGTTRKIAIK